MSGWVSVEYEGDGSGEGGDEQECESERQVRMSVKGDNDLSNEHL